MIEVLERCMSDVRGKTRDETREVEARSQPTLHVTWSLDSRGRGGRQREVHR